MPNYLDKYAALRSKKFDTIAGKFLSKKFKKYTLILQILLVRQRTFLLFLMEPDWYRHSPQVVKLGSLVDLGGYLLEYLNL